MRSVSAPIGPVLTVAPMIGLAGCGEPLRPRKWKDPPGDIPEGEGLLTGEDGEWEIYRNN